MPEPTAQRTLVKSPPELWAEVSDVESLARHLGEFGEIRITRTVPETTVVWEGDRARGRVELEPSGWGTKVTLTASALDTPASAATFGPVAPVVEAEPEPEPEPVAAVPEPEPAAVAAPPEPAPMTANEMLAKSGFFARMFKGRNRDEPQAGIGEPPVPAPDPAPPTPTPDPTPPAPDPVPPSPVPDFDIPPPTIPDPEPIPEPEPIPDPSPIPPPTPVPDPPGPDVLPEPTPLHPPQPDDEPPPAAHAPLDVESVLVGVLDTLGAAHHRPFSR